MYLEKVLFQFSEGDSALLIISAHMMNKQTGYAHLGSSSQEPSLNQISSVLDIPNISELPINEAQRIIDFLIEHKYLDQEYAPLENWNSWLTKDREMVMADVGVHVLKGSSQIIASETPDLNADNSTGTPIHVEASHLCLFVRNGPRSRILIDVSSPKFTLIQEEKLPFSI